jgi:hypothetical protein
MEVAMTFNARTARRLCSDSELVLYEQGRQFELQRLDAKHLKRNINRARRLHEQFARRARGKRVNPQAAEKAALFLEIAHRYERQLVSMMARLTQRNDEHEPLPAPEENGPEYARLGPPSEETKARVHAQEIAQSATQRIQGMISSQDRRTQIRHDKR